MDVPILIEDSTQNPYNYATPIVLPQSWCTLEFLDNSPISEPALELHSRAAPSVEGIIAQSVLPQGEIPEEGRTVREKKDRKKKLSSDPEINHLAAKHPENFGLN